MTDSASRISGENLKITAGDLIVNYDDNGPVYAPVVVFVHGTPFNKSVWDLQAEALKSNYRVITYDLRGHGQTEGPADDLTVQKHTEDLFRLIDVLHLDKVILCGISLGGYIALSAIEQNHDKFNALVLCSTQCGTDNEEVLALRQKQIEVLDNKGMEVYADELMAELFAPTSFTTRKEEVRAVHRIILATRAASVRTSLLALSERKESCSNLWDIKIPVLIMAGKEDAITPPAAAQFMRDNINGSLMHVIDYAGHLANLENTHEFNVLFKKFIDKVCAKKHLSRHCSDEFWTAEPKKLIPKITNP
mgnify:CR=1 FL=1